MKQFIDKAQNIGRRAAELRQAVKNLPGQAAKIREAVTMTGGELHQLRADVESSIHALRADTEERLLKTMREVNDHALVFEEAGYELTGMDLDMAVNQRLAVHLERFEEVPHADLRALFDSQRCESVRSILLGILKAEETSANVELSHLNFVGLVVHAGLTPMIRMEWRVVDAPEEVAVKTAAPAMTAPLASVASSAPKTSFPPMVSMFETRALPPGSGVPIPSASASPGPMPASPGAPIKFAPPEPAGSAWSQSALERFKKMPGASKYG